MGHRMKKVLFVVPKYKNVWEPLGISYIAAYCNKHYKDDLIMGVLNLNFNHLNYDYLRSFDIVAFTSTTPTYPQCLEIAKNLPDTHTVLGGWHATATPQTIHIAFDQVVIGEGEVPFLKILYGNRNRFISGRPLAFEHLPWPNRELIGQEQMLDLCEDICGERITALQSRRGCSHSCTFCSEKLMSSNNVRVRDPDDVLDELEEIAKNYNITSFKFLDPTWAHPRRAVIDFCNAKIQRRNTIPFEANAHIAYMDQYMLQLAKKAGCNQLNFGVESGSQKLLNDMKKGVTVQKIKDVFKWAKLERIGRRAFFILGMPNETEETIEETRELIREIQPSVVGFTMLCPYPSTQYWQDRYEGTDFSTMDEYSNNLINSKQLSNQDLKDIQKSLNEEFYDILVEHKK